MSPRSRMPLMVMIVALLAVATGVFLVRDSGQEPRLPKTRDVMLRQEAVVSADTVVPVPSQRNAWEEIDNPAGEGWDTEVFSRQAGAQLGPHRGPSV